MWHSKKEKGAFYPGGLILEEEKTELLCQASNVTESAHEFIEDRDCFRIRNSPHFHFHQKISSQNQH